MKTRKNIAALGVGITVLFAFAACEKAPVSSSKTDNPEITVELLFENDGVKVYRFHDQGRAIYYTDARGKTAWSVSQGKAGTRAHNVETVDE
jgi:hypothetical protein